eukprot:746893-Hanusia_phi.AAC.1
MEEGGGEERYDATNGQHLRGSLEGGGVEPLPPPRRLLLPRALHPPRELEPERLVRLADPLTRDRHLRGGHVPQVEVVQAGHELPDADVAELCRLVALEVVDELGPEGVVEVVRRKLLDAHRHRRLSSPQVPGLVVLAVARDVEAPAVPPHPPPLPALLLRLVVQPAREPSPPPLPHVRDLHLISHALSGMIMASLGDCPRLLVIVLVRRVLLPPPLLPRSRLQRLHGVPHP